MFLRAIGRGDEAVAEVESGLFDEGVHGGAEEEGGGDGDGGVEEEDFADVGGVVDEEVADEEEGEEMPEVDGIGAECEKCGDSCEGFLGAEGRDGGHGDEGAGGEVVEGEAGGVGEGVFGADAEGGEEPEESGGEEGSFEFFGAGGEVLVVEVEVVGEEDAEEE